MIDFTTPNPSFICYRLFLNDGNNNLRDLDQVPGWDRGRAHMACNLNYKYTLKVPVMLQI